MLVDGDLGSDRAQVLRQQPAGEADPLSLPRHAALRLRSAADRGLSAYAAAATGLPAWRATTRSLSPTCRWRGMTWKSAVSAAWPTGEELVDWPRARVDELVGDRYRQDEWNLAYGRAAESRHDRGDLPAHSCDGASCRCSLVLRLVAASAAILFSPRAFRSGVRALSGLASVCPYSDSCDSD